MIVSRTHLASCNQREYDPPMCASTHPDVCKQLQLRGAELHKRSAEASRVDREAGPVNVPT
jgi:hypothetical protein